MEVEGNAENVMGIVQFVFALNLSKIASIHILFTLHVRSEPVSADISDW
jgi:hypothetical protein